MKRTITLVLAVAALAAAAAPAQSTPVQKINAQERARGNDPRVVGVTPQALAPVQRIIAQEQARSQDPALFSVAAGTPIQIVQPGGFHWGDAGIGAAIAFALMLLALGGTLVVRQGRVRSA